MNEQTTETVGRKKRVLWLRTVHRNGYADGGRECVIVSRIVRFSRDPDNFKGSIVRLDNGDVIRCADTPQELTNEIEECE
jgi:hypothetical protein